MPIPRELEGKQLRGSIWIRRLGKHRGYRWELDNFNEAGVKLAPIESGARGHTGRVTSIQWPMFMNLYQPEGNLALIVTVDKEGFVQSVVPEKNGVVAAKEVPPVPMRLCMGAWHRKDGKGTPLPESLFSIVHRGPNTGGLATSCDDCREKNANWNKKKALLDGKVKLVAPSRPPEPEIPVPLVKLPAEPVYKLEELWLKEPTKEALPRQVASGSMPQWKVTIIKPTEVIVSAADYLDAGVAAGEGEVIKVERL